MILTVTFGSLFFYANREKIQEQKEKEDKNPRRDLAERFPKLSKIPLLRSFVGWMQWE